MTDGIINQLAELSKATVEPGDYTKDGLLYCGKCNMPKQCRISFGSFSRVLGCNCSCREEKFQKDIKEMHENEQRLKIEELRVNGIQDRAIRAYTFENSEMTPLMQSCKKYVDRWREVLQGNHGLIFWGDVGSGKTRAAACIANALIDRGVPALMTSFPRILSMDFKDRSEQIQQIVKFPLLLIDDLGAERSSDYSLETMYYVVDERYKSGKPLIVTTNLTLKQLENPSSIEYARIYSRILEMCRPVRVNGKNRREKKAEEKKDQFMEIFKNRE